MELTDIVYSYVNNATILNQVYDKELEKLAIEQSLQTLLYPVTKIREYKRYYISWVIKQEEFYSMQDEITRLFNENKIKHIYFKGSIISKLYDDPSVRTRGDIDLYVENSKFELARKVLMDNGFEHLDKEEDNLHHVTYEKNGISVELHYRMFDADAKKSWNNLFSNPLENAINVMDSLYEFTPTYHFIYCLMHFALHLRIGAGIRYILDFYYLFKKTNINMEKLHILIHSNRLDILYSNVINAIRTIFGIDFDESIGNEDVTFFIDYMLSYGIHGNSNNETEKRTAYHQNKYKYAISKILLTNKEYRKTKYPKLGSHFYLYPICLIKHWIYLLTHKLGSFFKFIFGKNKNKELYNKLGI